MFKLLKLFLLCPGVGELDDDIVDPDEPVDPPEDDPVDPPNEDDPVDPPEDEPVQKVSRAQKEIITLRERAQRAEEQHRQAMTELENARKQTTQTAQPSQEQKLWEQEEAVLKDPAADAWQKYSVQSARDARAALAESRNATRQAQDAADKAEFERVASMKPKTFAAYKDKVEETLTNMRKNGNNAPRKDLMAFLVGRDMLEGKLKAETKTTKPAGDSRGKTPGARTDVSSSGSKLSEAEKREKRLENVRI